MQQARPKREPRIPARVGEYRLASQTREQARAEAVRWAKRKHNERALAVGQQHISLGQDDRTGAWYFYWVGPAKLRNGARMLIDALSRIPGAQAYVSTTKHHVVRWPAPADEIAAIPLWPRTDYEAPPATA